MLIIKYLLSNNMIINSKKKTVDTIDNLQENHALTRLESYAVSELMYRKRKEKFEKEASINKY